MGACKNLLTPALLFFSLIFSARPTYATEVNIPLPRPRPPVKKYVSTYDIIQQAIEEQKIKRQQELDEQKRKEAQARIDYLTELYAPYKDARTKEAETIRAMMKVRDDARAAITTAQQELATVKAAVEPARLEIVSAEAAAATAAAKAKQASITASISEGFTRQYRNSLQPSMTLAVRAKAASRMMESSALRTMAEQAELDSAKAEVEIHVAKLAHIDAQIAVAEKEIQLASAVAEFSRYKISYFPLLNQDKDLAAQVTSSRQRKAAIDALRPIEQKIFEAAQAKVAHQKDVLRAASAQALADLVTDGKIALALLAIPPARDNLGLVLAEEIKYGGSLLSAQAALKTLIKNNPNQVYEISRAESTIAFFKTKLEKARMDRITAEAALATVEIAAETSVGRIHSSFTSNGLARANSDLERSNRQMAESKKARKELATSAAEYRARSKVVTLAWLAYITAKLGIEDADKAALYAKTDAGFADEHVKNGIVEADRVKLEARSRDPRNVYSDSRLESMKDTRAAAAALALDSQRIAADADLKVANLKLLAGKAQLYAATLKIKSLQVHVDAAKAHVAAEEAKTGTAVPAHVATAKAEVDAAVTILQAEDGTIDSAQAEISQAEDEITAVQNEIKRIADLIKNSPPRVKEQMGLWLAEDKAKEDAKAAAVAAKQAARDAYYEKMSKLYNIEGYKTSRSDAYKKMDEIRNAQLKANAKSWAELIDRVRMTRVMDIAKLYEGMSCKEKDDTGDEMKCLICNSWFEANNQSIDGMLLSANSVMNRFTSGLETSVCKTVYHYKWYSWVLNPPDDNRNLIIPKSTDNPEFYKKVLEKPYIDAVHASVLALSQKTPYILNHYYAIKGPKGYHYPDWSRKPLCIATKVRIEGHYACYLPIDGANNYAQWEIDLLLTEKPELFDRAQQE